MAVTIGNIAPSAAVNSSPLNAIFSSYANEINRLAAYLPAGTAAAGAATAATPNTLALRDANGAFAVGGMTLNVANATNGGLGIIGIAGQTGPYLSIVDSAIGAVFSVAAPRAVSVAGTLGVTGVTTTAGILNTGGARFQGAAGNPVSAVLQATNYALTQNYFTVTPQSTAGLAADSLFVGSLTSGNFVANAVVGTIAGTFRGETGDTLGRGVLVVQNHAGTNNYVNVVSAGDAANATTIFAGEVAVTGSPGTINMAPVTLPAGTANQGVIAYDTSSQALRMNNNNTGWSPLGGSAAAVGASGTVQYTTGSGAFAGDSNHYWDGTNHRLGLALGGSPAVGTLIDMAGVLTIRQTTLPTPSLAAQGMIGYAASSNQLMGSNNAGAFAPIILGNAIATQTIGVTGTGAQIVLSATAPASGIAVHGTLVQDTGWISTQGTQAGLLFFDRTGAPGNPSSWYRDATYSYLWSAEKLQLLTVQNSTGALGIALGGAGIPPSGLLHVKQPVSGTGDIAFFDGSANTNGVIYHIDSYGRDYQTQAAAPTLIFSTGAGTGATGTVTGTDQEGTISITTGTAPAGSNALIVQLTFRNPYAVAPKTAHLWPANAATINLARNQDIGVATVTTALVNISAGAVALGAGTFVWGYRIVV